MQHDAGFTETNNTWVSESEVETPEDLPELCGTNILVRPLPVREKTKGGIILTASSQDHIELVTSVGKVLKVGPLAYKDSWFKGEVFCKEGDLVCYGKYAGQKFSWKGVKLLLVPDDQVLMRISKPEYLDDKFIHVGAE